MNESETTAAPPGRLHPQIRDLVAVASMVMLIREMKLAGTPEAAAAEIMETAPDKIDAALTRGRQALVFYQVDARGARGIVSDDEAKLDAFARRAHAAGSRVLCFNPTLAAALATVTEPRVNDLIETTAGRRSFDA